LPKEKGANAPPPQTATRTLFITFPEQTYDLIVEKLDEKGEDAGTILLMALGLLR